MSAYFTDLMLSIASKGRQFLKTTADPSDPRKVSGLTQICEDLLSGRGEASGTAMARAALDRYAALDTVGKQSFFERLALDFGPSREGLDAAIRAWQGDPSDARAADIHYLSEPRRIELFRRLNRAPGGAASLVEIRADLLAVQRQDPSLKIVDRDLVHLLSSWFNRGFLVLRRIDWSSPALVLAKLIKYEAVHEIRDWDDLRGRLDPMDRRCYAFFHPALADEPLIFLEVALTADLPRAIEPLLSPAREITPLAYARYAVFYSISNCLVGLSGISFGNFLIKQVVEDLRKEAPNLESFVTLSPAPGFMTWLRSEAHSLDLASDQRRLLAELDSPNWVENETLVSALRPIVEPLAARYFLQARTAEQRIVDPVARFHLGNGARLEQIDWLGDRSPKALLESAGLMVNYLYDPDQIESNHERYANDREVIASSAVRRLIRTPSRLKFGGSGHETKPETGSHGKSSL